MPARMFVCAACAAMLCVVHATDRKPTEDYFEALEQRFRREYRMCTGDSGDVDLNVVMLWKKELGRWLEGYDYKELVDSYVEATGTPRDSVVPCKAAVWQQRREHKRRHAVRARRADSLARREAEAESLAVAKDLSVNPASPFCPPGIPFGVNRASVVWLLERNDVQVLKEARYVLATDLPWDGHAFPTAFHFNGRGQFCRYEIEGMHYPADSVDTAVRRQASMLTGVFSERLGTPDSVHRVGLFDIGTAAPAPYREWHDGNRFLKIAFTTHRYLYNVRVAAVDSALVDRR